MRLQISSLYVNCLEKLFLIIDPSTQDAFRVFDKENRGERRVVVVGEKNALRSCALGLISGEELRHVLTRFGEPMDESEANDYIAEAEAKCPDVR